MIYLVVLEGNYLLASPYLHYQDLLRIAGCHLLWFACLLRTNYDHHRHLCSISRELLLRVDLYSFGPALCPQLTPLGGE